MLFLLIFLKSHIWDYATPIDETLRTFDDLVRCGKIRYFGVSNVCGWQLQKIVDRIQSMGLNNCVTLQVRLNYFFGLFVVLIVVTSVTVVFVSNITVRPTECVALRR